MTLDNNQLSIPISAYKLPFLFDYLKSQSQSISLPNENESKKKFNIFSFNSYYFEYNNIIFLDSIERNLLHVPRRTFNRTIRPPSNK